MWNLFIFFGSSVLAVGVIGKLALETELIDNAIYTIEKKLHIERLN